VIVVCDASPIISLASVGWFDLLRQLYDKISVPDAVYQEVTRAGERAGAGELASADWVERRTLGNDFLARALYGELDYGESEAIALAVELGADLLLVDERQGRAVAARFGLKVAGVLGVLVEAKRKALLPRIEPVLEDLQSKAGFRISQDLRRRVLEEVGEGP
jgi:predicted nucleic acid-binding protein